MNTRQSSDGPFCWQSKAARRRIREAFDATNNVATALGVYDALCEIASDAQAETFTTTHAWIQRISGVGVSTIKNHLGVFSELELLRICTPALRAPSTYILISVSQRLTNDSQPPANVSQRPNIGGLATSEESQKNLRRIEKKAPPTLAEWLAYADELKWFHPDASAAFDHYEANGWKQSGGNSIKKWQA